MTLMMSSNQGKTGTFYFVASGQCDVIMEGMPRTARASVGNAIYHVLNRGNARNEVFHKDGDYGAFLKLLTQANDRVNMRLLAFCLMPNH